VGIGEAFIEEFPVADKPPIVIHSNYGKISLNENIRY
jgi:hypothetical protein